MEKYDIKKFVELVCSQPTLDDMELITQKEMERVDMGNVDNLNTEVWDEYCRMVYDIFGYIRVGRFRNFIPEFKPLVEKLKKH